jgi:hypothetical protein
MLGGLCCPDAIEGHQKGEAHMLMILGPVDEMVVEGICS